MTCYGMAMIDMDNDNVCSDTSVTYLFIMWIDQ